MSEKKKREQEREEARAPRAAPTQHSALSTQHAPFPGRVMALDLGEKRIGVAMSDPTRTIAASHGVIERGSREADFAEYGRLIAEQDVKLLVIGLPLSLSGAETDKSAWVRDYAAELATHIETPIEFWDEAMTTIQAEASLRQRGKRGKKARARVDAVAAAFILQSYLDAHVSG